MAHKLGRDPSPVHLHNEAPGFHGELVSRRGYIGQILSASLGAFCGLMLVLGKRYLWPQRRPLYKEIRVEGWLQAASAGEVTQNRLKQFAYGKIPGVIIGDRGEMQAFSLLCSHLGCVLNWSPDRRAFICPCHGGEFNSRGQAIVKPPEEPLKKFAVQVREDRIYVKPSWLT
jgi:nitrite reductase/ring-hydroxylating ferredoxin subunit